jgi:hypothetical protein
MLSTVTPIGNSAPAWSAPLQPAAPPIAKGQVA